MNYREYIKYYKTPSSPIYSDWDKSVVKGEDFGFKAESDLPLSTGDPEKDASLKAAKKLSENEGLEIVAPELLVMPMGETPLLNKAISWVGDKVIKGVKGIQPTIEKGVKAVSRALDKGDKTIAQDVRVVSRPVKAVSESSPEAGIQKSIDFLQSDYNRERLRSAGYSEGQIDKLINYQVNNIKEAQLGKRIELDDAYFKAYPESSARSILDPNSGTVTVKYRSSANPQVLEHEMYHVGTNNGMTKMVPSDRPNFIELHNNQYIPDLSEKVLQSGDEKLVSYFGNSQEFQARAKVVMDELKEFGISLDEFEEAVLNKDLSNPKIVKFLQKYNNDQQLIEILDSYKRNPKLFESMRNVWGLSIPVGIGYNLYESDDVTGVRKEGGIINYLNYISL